MEMTANCLTTLLAIILLFLLLIFYLYKRSAKEAIPGPTGIPIFSNVNHVYYAWKSAATAKHIKLIVYVLQMLCGLAVIMEEYPVAFFRIITKPYILLWKPEAVEVVLSSNVLLDKGQDYKFLHSWLGTGLLTSHGNKWRFRRKLLTPTFHYRILEDFFPIVNEQAEVLVDKLRERLKADEQKGQDVFDVVPMVTHCALDIICETALGVKVGAQNNSSSLYVQSLANASETILNRIVKPWLWNETIFKMMPIGKKFYRSLDILHGFTKKAITKRKMEMKKAEEHRGPKAFLDLLLHDHFANPELLTEEDIREEVDTFTFEGHDTTAMGISWALYLIGLNPEVQKKIQEELASVCGSDVITLEDVKNMKYLECAMKESQRLYPSVPFIARELKHEVDIGGHRIPKGTSCIILTYQLHRNPHVFPEPERFDPERFTLENASGRHPYAYVPFSAGPRNCIGQRFAIMEEKTILANVLRSFDVTSVDPRDRIHLQAEFISRSAQGIRLKLRQR